MRSPLRYALVAGAVLVALTPATAPAAAPAAGHRQLSGVTELAAGRPEPADTVAAAKRGTDGLHSAGPARAVPSVCG